MKEVTAADICAASNIQKVRELNDAFRTTFVGGVVLVTQGVEALEAGVKARVLHRVRIFDDFSEKNDPHGEHDFCCFLVEGQRFFAKIDYYDREMQNGSEDPADPTKTTRVLTVMRADEY
jgi:hypothetical protein